MILILRFKISDYSSSGAAGAGLASVVSAVGAGDADTTGVVDVEGAWRRRKRRNFRLPPVVGTLTDSVGGDIVRG